MTFIPSVKAPGECTPIDAGEIFDRMRSGEYERPIYILRLVLHRSRQAYDLEKVRRLPAILWAGDFLCAKDDGIRTHSGLTCLDVDGIPGCEVDRLKGEFAKLNCVRAVFISPSGEGLKVIVRIPCQSPNDHKRITQAVTADLAAKVPLPDGVKFDKTEDLSRKCFVSWDPDLHDNPHAVPWSGTFTEYQSLRVSDVSDVSEKQMLSPLTAFQAPPPIQTPGPGVPAEVVRALIMSHEKELIPTKPDDNHKRRFMLARLVLQFSEEHGIAKADCRDVFFNEWHSIVMERDPKFLPGLKADYKVEFFQSIHTAIVPLGGNAVDIAVQRMATTQPPPIAGRYADNPDMVTLLHLLHTLSAMQPTGAPFFLSSRDGGKVIGKTAPTTATYLRFLVMERILTVAVKHTETTATRYLWNGDIPTK